MWEIKKNQRDILEAQDGSGLGKIFFQKILFYFHQCILDGKVFNTCKLLFGLIFIFEWKVEAGGLVKVGAGQSSICCRGKSKIFQISDGMSKHSLP